MNNKIKSILVYSCSNTKTLIIEDLPIYPYSLTTTEDADPAIESWQVRLWGIGRLSDCSVCKGQCLLMNILFVCVC